MTLLVDADNYIHYIDCKSQENKREGLQECYQCRIVIIEGYCFVKMHQRSGAFLDCFVQSYKIAKIDDFLSQKYQKRVDFDTS